MALSIGIIGLPNAGKSTLFNALLDRQAAKVAERPFTTIEPNTGVVPVPDERLKKLAALVKPDKVVTATVTFIDIAGLVKGAHRGEGLGNKFLSHIRSCDAILHLVRAFSGSSVSRVESSVDPASDVEIVNLEMVMADFEIVSLKLEETAKKARTETKLRNYLAALEKLKKVLEEGKFASEAGLSQEEKDLLKELNLLTLKPVVYVLNTDEGGPAEGKGLSDSIGALQICALLEAEVIGLDPEEKKKTLAEFGVKEPGLDKLIKAAYRLLGLISFYTIKGGKEVHAWPLKNGSSALDAAAKVHSDMAKGFIKAEVVELTTLFASGTWLEAKKQGKLRLEGKDYQVKDGEVIEFKFN